MHISARDGSNWRQQANRSEVECAWAREDRTKDKGQLLEAITKLEIYLLNLQDIEFHEKTESH